DVILDSSHITVLNSVFAKNETEYENPMLDANYNYLFTALAVLDSTNIFVGNDTFAGPSVGLYIWNGTSNLVWGNVFFSNNTQFSLEGIDMDSSGNTIYNNYFWGLFEDVYSFYTNTNGAYVNNTWNIANQSASTSHSFNGHPFSGSIIGTSY
ncbi:hypothetical protein B2A_14321, partial [mine drainage metagenome]